MVEAAISNDITYNTEKFLKSCLSDGTFFLVKSYRSESREQNNNKLSYPLPQFKVSNFLALKKELPSSLTVKVELDMESVCKKSPEQYKVFSNAPIRRRPRQHKIRRVNFCELSVVYNNKQIMKGL